MFEAETFDLALAREVTASDIEAVFRYSVHANGRQPTLKQIENLGVVVAHEMRRACEALDGDGVEFRIESTFAGSK